MKTLVVLLLLSVLCHGKEIGLHDAASDKYRQHIHEDLKISRISVIEEEVAMEHHFHPWNGTSAHKHLSVIGMVEGSPSMAYVRVLGDHEEDGSHPMHEHEAVHAIWVKDEEGKIVHLTEFDDNHEEDQKAHTEFDVKAYQTALDGGASARSAPKLTPYALCYNHGTLSIWEGRPFKLPPLPIKEEL